ncbi:MAG TPA: histidinol dehydrogenase [Coleofasciculaceae cyanobacterium]|jgi:histidinol dehydrogenase
MIPVYTGAEAFEQLDAILYLKKSDENAVEGTVKEIIRQVQSDGDSALKALAERFGERPPSTFLLPKGEIQAAVARVPEKTKQLLNRAAANIRTFGEAVMQAAQPVVLDRGDFQVGLDWKPVERAACYVPGGRYPLPSTALMTAITAQAAGVPEICIASPALKDEIIYAGTLAGVRTFYQVGGAQAVAALAFGTQTIQPVDLIVGPGNAYVTEAKRQLQGTIGIDMLAGPSEVAIMADAGANPHWVALDLLAQAEHDIEARAYLLTDSEELARQVNQELAAITRTHMELPAFLRQTTYWGAMLVFPSLEDCIQAANALAPEHLELHVRNPDATKDSLKHYGALFMGDTSPVPLGDYMAGPNHTLPTGRTARFAGGLNPMTFLRPQSWIRATAQATELAADAAKFAGLEGLTAHRLSAQARLQSSPASLA